MIALALADSQSCARLSIRVLTYVIRLFIASTLNEKDISTTCFCLFNVHFTLVLCLLRYDLSEALVVSGP